MNSGDQKLAQRNVSNPITQTTTKNPYEENFKEIARREDVMKKRQERIQKELDGLIDTDPQRCSTTGSGTVPSDSEYDFALITKAHMGLSPKSKEPAVRCYGFFKTKKDALCHVNDLKRQGIDISEFGDIRLTPRMKWFLIPTNKDKEDDADYTLGKIEQLRRIHNEEREASNRDFETKRAGKSAKGKAPISLAKRQEKEAQNPKNKTTRHKAMKALKSEMDKTVETNPELEVANVPRAAELRGQNHVVVGIWKDYTNERMKLKIEPEPAVLLIDCFDRLEDAENCVKDTLAKYINQLHLDIVDLYEWVYPERMNPDKLPAAKEIWRDEEQSLIMKSHKEEGSRHAKYQEQSQLQLGKAGPIHDIVAGEQKEAEIRPLESTMTITQKDQESEASSSSSGDQE